MKVTSLRHRKQPWLFLERGSHCFLGPVPISSGVYLKLSGGCVPQKVPVEGSCLPAGRLISPRNSTFAGPVGQRNHQLAQMAGTAWGSLLMAFEGCSTFD